MRACSLNKKDLMNYFVQQKTQAEYRQSELNFLFWLLCRKLCFLQLWSHRCHIWWLVHLPCVELTMENEKQQSYKQMGWNNLIFWQSTTTWARWLPTAALLPGNTQSESLKSHWSLSSSQCIVYNQPPKPVLLPQSIPAQEDMALDHFPWSNHHLRKFVSAIVLPCQIFHPKLMFSLLLLLGVRWAGHFGCWWLCWSLCYSDD